MSFHRYERLILSDVVEVPTSTWLTAALAKLFVSDDQTGTESCLSSLHKSVLLGHSDELSIKLETHTLTHTHVLASEAILSSRAILNLRYCKTSAPVVSCCGK